MIFHVNPLLRQRIHMKHHALFSSKDKKKNLVSSAAILLGALMVTHGNDYNWLLKTGDPLIPVQLHCTLVQGAQERWLFKTGDPFIEVITLAGLTVLSGFKVNSSR